MDKAVERVIEILVVKDGPNGGCPSCVFAETPDRGGCSVCYIEEEWGINCSNEGVHYELRNSRS